MGTQIRIIRTGKLGIVKTAYRDGCYWSEKEVPTAYSPFKHWDEVEPFFWPDAEDDDGEGESSEVLPRNIQDKSDFGTRCIPGRGTIVQFLMTKQPGTYATGSTQADNPGIRLLHIRHGATNNDVHKQLLAGVQAFVAPDEGADAQDDSADAQDDSADAPVKAPYVLGYKLTRNYHKSRVPLPKNDEEFNVAACSSLVAEYTSRFMFHEFSAVGQHESLDVKKVKAALNLESCLKRFSKEEQLDKFNEWYCPSCKKHVQAFKAMDLYRLPEILVIQLKRFEYEEGASFYGQRTAIRNKITSVVDFPVEGLDLSAIVQGPQEQPPIYDLFAISNHHGGLGGGHYTAYGKNFHNGKWYDFNDSYVKEVRVSELVTAAAYVLFYRRRVEGATAAADAELAAPSDVPKEGADGGSPCEV